MKSSANRLAALTALVLGGLGCGKVQDTPSDAATSVPDAPAPDAAAACKPKPMLLPGSDIVPQGWTQIASPPATLTNPDGGSFVQLTTTTQTNATVSGALLLTYPKAFTPGTPAVIEIQMKVVQVNNHNQYDAAVAILPAVTGTGTQGPIGSDRDQMVYLDSGAVGFADDTQTPFQFNVLDGQYHTYVMAIDASNTLTFKVDGTVALVRTNISSNGTFGIGDQTNDPMVDGSIQIRSITKLCD